MSLYSDLPQAVKSRASELDLKPHVAANYPVDFLKSRVPAKDVDNELFHSILVLDNSNTIKRKSKPTRKKPLSSKAKRELKIYDITKDLGSYEVYLPLHKLWLDYFREAMDLEKVNLKSGNKSQLYAKLFKADYHGCILSVTRSKCPSYVGITGILLQETRNALKLITKENKLKTIPKFNSVFTFEVDGAMFTIHGNHFRVKSSERAVKKFKAKATLNL